MCVAMPEEGEEFLDRLTEAHLSPLGGARPAPGSASTPRTPPRTCRPDDDELAGLIAELVIVAGDEPASAESMELNFLLLEQRRLEAEIAAAGEADEDERRAALSTRAGRAGRAHRPHRASRLAGKFLPSVPG